jgi:hypothetical protein
MSYQTKVISKSRSEDISVELDRYYNQRLITIEVYVSVDRPDWSRTRKNLTTHLNFLDEFIDDMIKEEVVSRVPWT